MKRHALAIVIVVGALATSSGVSQIMPYETPSMVSSSPNPKPKSYTDYYMRNLQRYHQPQANVRNYTIDKYYLHNPNVSPYSMLTRRGGISNLNNYYRYVRPELERRSQLNPLAGPGVVGMVNKAPAPAPVGPPPGYTAGVPNRAPINPIIPNRPDALAPKGSSSYYKKIYQQY